ncbi:MULTISPECIES: hypothetical protein [unclassified Microcoleus]|jgi:hypothetical protein|uniref:hypothetical protein n=1 Tax=unclassified Microcoleus TaxID=2642155 RepID=UPI001E022133|nr:MULTISPECIES: hypothetical protein [unclassified Microcoleus]MCC3431007.1 hypothetical protein [Microcoleus sp. PH2017_04_SCI_O_A]MCC3468094.1 hypothetical protein [Microcoleus sp. PH2017_06_SFM_O_A]MCC3502015.1 hypothetical protein [Microcoleus sp. PH2017_19_SFW_U_A]TAE16876.1 MAG: hypothetical protein EAZ94_00595 [Oscillatoriales cyanobacterium]MCC3413185.1 hypothetical protein [Microcoleus sp. PH2017_02_FOX_O_A]
MPSEQSHREQAKNNEEAALSIRDTFPDWAVTMCFYSALHCIEAYAKVQKVDLEEKYQGSSSPHDRLFDYVRDIADRRDRSLEKAYKNLKNESQIARYLTGMKAGIKTSIKTNSRFHYTRHTKIDVDRSFDNLQIVKKLLNP